MLLTGQTKLGVTIIHTHVKDVVIDSFLGLGPQLNSLCCICDCGFSSCTETTLFERCVETSNSLAAAVIISATTSY